EPVSTLALRYEADLDLATASAEAGRSPEEFKAALGASESLTRNLGALRVAGGTVSRQVFVQTFGDLVGPLNLGVLLAQTTPTGQELRRFDGHLGLVAGVAFSPDGRRALSAGFDQAAVLWDLDSGQELKRFEPAGPFVHLAAFTPDGRHALFAGDNGLTLWD